MFIFSRIKKALHCGEPLKTLEWANKFTQDMCMWPCWEQRAWPCWQRAHPCSQTHACCSVKNLNPCSKSPGPFRWFFLWICPLKNAGVEPSSLINCRATKQPYILFKRITLTNRLIHDVIITIFVSVYIYIYIICSEVMGCRSISHILMCDQTKWSRHIDIYIYSVMTTMI